MDHIWFRLTFLNHGSLVATLMSLSKFLRKKMVVELTSKLCWIIITLFVMRVWLIVVSLIVLIFGAIIEEVKIVYGNGLIGCLLLWTDFQLFHPYRFFILNGFVPTIFLFVCLRVSAAFFLCIKTHFTVPSWPDSISQT